MPRSQPVRHCKGREGQGCPHKAALARGRHLCTGCRKTARYCKGLAGRPCPTKARLAKSARSCNACKAAAAPIRYCRGAKGKPCPNKAILAKGIHECDACKGIKAIPTRYCKGVPGKPCLYGLELQGEDQACPQCKIDAWLSKRPQHLDVEPETPGRPRYPLRMPDFSKWTCKRCGCTERVACPPTCWWVAPQLCSGPRCATPEEHFVYAVAVELDKTLELFNGVFELPKQYRLRTKGREDIEERAEGRQASKKERGRAIQFAKVGRLRTKGRPAGHATITGPHLLDLLNKETGVTLAALAKHFKVSKATVRPVLGILIKEKNVRVDHAAPTGGVGQPPKVYFRI